MKRLLATLLCAAMLFSLCSCKAGGSNAGTANFKAQYIRTNGGSKNTMFPSAFIIRSAEELTDYYEKNKTVFDLGHREQVYADSTIGFLDASSKYDESYFADHILLLVLLEENSGSIRHNVAKAERTEDGKLHLNIQKRIPEVVTTDMAQWHIFIELGKEYNVASNADVIINEQVNQAATDPTQSPTDDTPGGPEEYLCKVTSIDGVTRYPAQENSQILRDVLEGLSYSQLELCDCEAEYTLDNGYGVHYSVNLTEGFARCELGQAKLTEADLLRLRPILHWAKLDSPLPTIGHPTVPDDSTKVRFDAQYIRTNGYREGAVFPRVVIIRSVEELKTYYEQNKYTFDLERRDKVYSDSSIGFLDACDRYDEAYFSQQILVMVLLQEGSGSVRHQVTSVGITEDGKLNITIDSQCPEISTDDMAQWHILVEPEAGVDVESAEDVLINGKAVSQKQPDNVLDK